MLLAPFDFLQKASRLAYTETVLHEEKHLPVPSARIQRPTVRNAKKGLSPFVVRRCAARDANCGHYFFPELTFGEVETLADVGFTGSTTGAPLFLSRTTMNFAGFVVLAFRPTV